MAGGCVLSILASVGAKLPLQGHLLEPVARRGFLVTSLVAGLSVRDTLPAEASVFDSTCFGFGCNSYRGTDYGGAPAPSTGEPMMSFQDFVAQLKDEQLRKKVRMVDIYGAGGEQVYVSLTSGDKVRVGEGLPIEDSNGWSSSLWLVRILKNEGVPFEYHFRPGDTP